MWAFAYYYFFNRTTEILKRSWYYVNGGIIGNDVTWNVIEITWQIFQYVKPGTVFLWNEWNSIFQLINNTKFDSMSDIQFEPYSKLKILFEWLKNM